LISLEGLGDGEILLCKAGLSGIREVPTEDDLSGSFGNLVLFRGEVLGGGSRALLVETLAGGDGFFPAEFDKSMIGSEESGKRSGAANIGINRDFLPVEFIPRSMCLI